MTGPKGTQARYGIDAPMILAMGTLATLINVVLGIVSGGLVPWLVAAALAVLTALYVHTTWRGKFVVWDRLLAALPLRGDERILDLGCGRGMVLIREAKRLTTGTAVGVDIWSRADQSGNAMQATRDNAAIEGVTDRIELHTADMRSLPFPDASFDHVTANLAIHNIHGADGRRNAIDEAFRVLKPGGQLLIADIFATRLYRRRLVELGAVDVSRRNLGWRMWWGGPWMPTHLVTAGKAGK